MSDFGNDQYHEMICVEPGVLGDTNVLPVEPGQQAVLEQMIQV
jgi:D-hexose-6-phosphate mutarotase